MELARRGMEAASRVVNSNATMNAVLVGAFGVLSVRSMQQQQQIEALEREKQSLLKANKAIKKAFWDSKQLLYADASSPDTATVPFSTLKAIYGDLPNPVHSDAGKGDGKSATSKILI